MMFECQNQAVCQTCLLLPTLGCYKSATQPHLRLQPHKPELLPQKRHQRATPVVRGGFPNELYGGVTLTAYHVMNIRSGAILDYSTVRHIALGQQ